MRRTDLAPFASATASLYAAAMLKPATLGVALAALFVSGGALCAGPASATEESRARVLEEIVVTSRRRTENLQDVPDAITALTSEMIESAGVDSVSDVTQLVPNLSMVETQQPGVELLVIRGVGQARNQEPPVAMVIDGVQLTSSYQLNQELYDVERIEVLKGPQGALYGRNAIGGAINIVTRKPGNEVEGKASVGLSNGGGWETKGLISGPVVENRVFFRLAGTYEDFDGTIRNVTRGEDVNHEKTWSLRGRLLAHASDRLTADLRATVVDTEAGAAYFAPATDANDVSTPVQGEYPGVGTRRIEEYALKLDYEMSGVTFSSISAVSSTEASLDEEIDYFPVPLMQVYQDLDVDAVSQEFRLTSNADGPLRWMLGAYYLDTQRDLDTQVNVDFGNYFAYLGNLASGNDPFAGLSSTANFAPLSTAISQDDDTAWAGFGQINYDLTGDVELTLALRYDQNEKENLDALSGVRSDADFDMWQPKVSVAWSVTEDAMIYATWSRGFRSGGFNATDTLGKIYDAEETTNYEAGFKSTWLDGLARVNGAVFRIDYDERQEFILIANEGAQALVNIPESRVTGLELDIAASLTESLDLQASAGWMDTEVLEFDASLYGFPPGADFTGNQLPFAYGWSYAIALQHRMPLGAGLELMSRLDYSARGDMAWHIDGYDTQNPVRLMNARIGFETEHFEVYAWAENLLDEEYNAEFIAREWSGGVADFKYPGPPRRYGVRFTYRF